MSQPWQNQLARQDSKTTSSNVALEEITRARANLSVEVSIYAGSFLLSLVGIVMIDISLQWRWGHSAPIQYASSLFSLNRTHENLIPELGQKTVPHCAKRGVAVAVYSVPR